MLHVMRVKCIQNISPLAVFLFSYEVTQLRNEGATFPKHLLFFDPMGDKLKWAIMPSCHLTLFA